MSPFGVSSALPDENSSNSLIMDSIHESPTLPITVSENASQGTCQDSQTLNASICTTKSPNRAYSQFTSSKVVMVSPVKSVNTGLISCSTSKTNLTFNDINDSITVLEKSPGSCDLNETNEFCFELEKQNQGKRLNDTPELKVVVQAMPTDCGNISALKQVIHDTISRKSWLKMKSKQNKAMAKKKLNGDQDWNPGRSKILKEATNNTNDTENTDLFSVDCSERKKLNPRLCFDIEPGNGIKLSEIQNVALAIRKCSDRTLQVIHYLLFNTYGGVGYDKSIKQTLRNIMEFSGYPFKAFSSAYNKKYHCLMRLPFPMLLKIYNVLVQQMSVERPTMVNELMKFCMKPVKTSKVPDLKPSKVYDEKYLEELKECAMNGPYPLILLEKLNESYIKLMEGRNIKKEKENSMIRPKDILNYFPNYVRPTFIRKGPGRKLKEIPYMTSGIFKARRRIINLIHCLLFKRPGSLDSNRLNILEFSGFLQCDNFFLERKLQILMKYKKKDLDQIFNIFNLNSTESRPSRMKKLLLFLQAPSFSKSKRNITKAQSQGDRTSKEKKSFQGKLANNNRSVTKLRDIEKVCLNIECSPPRELAALNDLLFIKPCDISELHEKVLNFTPFQFDENSMEFHYRKTLMHYMSFGVIRKIAHILDIHNWEKYEFPEELSDAILNFLLKLEQPVQDRKRRRKQPKNCGASNENCRPTILMVERDRNIFDQENPVSSSSGTYACNSPNNLIMENDEGNSNTTVVIQRISDSSYSWTDSRNNGPITISDRNSDECLTLNEFAHHPTESQLELVIKEEICSNSWNISTGDLLNKVHHHYPRLNLTYRNDFIKSKALEILHEMQECMIDSTFDE